VPTASEEHLLGGSVGEGRQGHQRRRSLVGERQDVGESPVEHGDAPSDECRAVKGTEGTDAQRDRRDHGPAQPVVVRLLPPQVERAGRERTCRPGARHAERQRVELPRVGLGRQGLAEQAGTGQADARHDPPAAVEGRIGLQVVARDLVDEGAEERHHGRRYKVSDSLAR
jgi:hypothetical protein